MHINDLSAKAYLNANLKGFGRTGMTLDTGEIIVSVPD